jgi:SAM-dependent methyltransferase
LLAKLTDRAHTDKLLTPAALAADFGAGSPVAQEALKSLYRALVSSSSPAVKRSFEQWVKQFGAAGAFPERLKGTALARLGRRLGLEEGPEHPSAFLFALHTYFAALAEFLAVQAATCFAFPHLGREPVEAAGCSPQALLAYLRKNLVEGGVFRAFRLKVFPDGHPFHWYLEVWDEALASALGRMLDRLAGYSLVSPETASQGPRDFLKRLYQQLVPSAIRHGLGEYYTPDWLACRLLERLEEGSASGLTDKRFLDPCCGSGTFLVLLICRLREQALKSNLSPGELLQTILRNVVGLDLNPLAVISARANYLLAVADLLPCRREEVEIPVYRVDAILPPTRPNSSGSKRAATSSLPWLAEGRFDYVVGNPPWVNWESLPEDYRAATRPLWEYYGLFPHGGMDAILGKGKKDLSMLLTYVALDRYLKPGGKLGFIITQSAFKTSGAGQGFRRLTLPDGTPVRVQAVEDLTELRPFEGANNRTCLMLLEKGRPNRYPVPYYYWQKVGPAEPAEELTLEEVLGWVRVHRLEAEPVAAEDPTSAWITGSRGAVRALRKILGPSAYRAHEGLNTGGANGVYWVEVVAPGPDGLVRITNVTRGAKRRVERITTVVEGELLCPLLRAAEVERWRAAPSAYVLVVQDPVRRRGLPEEEMLRRYPRAYAYLKRFEAVLRRRAAFWRYFTRKEGDRVVETGPFYSLFDVGTYTFAPYKVVWPRIASEIRAAVVAPEESKPVIPQETVTFVSTEDLEEAHYLCALLNSSLFNLAARAHSQRGGKSFGSGHLLTHIRVPKFDRASAVHRGLAELSRRAHVLRARGDSRGLAGVEAEIDRLTEELWGLNPAELEEIRAGSNASRQ